MVYKLTYDEIQLARKHLEEAESIFRKESLLLARIINNAHYEIDSILKEHMDYDKRK